MGSLFAGVVAVIAAEAATVAAVNIVAGAETALEANPGTRKNEMVAGIGIKGREIAWIVTGRRYEEGIAKRAGLENDVADPKNGKKRKYIALKL